MKNKIIKNIFIICFSIFGIILVNNVSKKHIEYILADSNPTYSCDGSEWSNTNTSDVYVNNENIQIVNTSDDKVVYVYLNGLQKEIIAVKSSSSYTVGYKCTVSTNSNYIYIVDGINIIYDANGGDGSVPVDNNIHPIGTEFALAENVSIYKENYAFVGWTLDPTSTTKYSAYTPDSNDVNNNTVTFYAMWKLVVKVDTATQRFKYDGNTHDVIVKAIDGATIPTDNFTIRYVRGQTEIEQPTQHGSYAVLVDRNEDDTYAEYHGVIYFTITNTVTYDSNGGDSSNYVDMCRDKMYYGGQNDTYAKTSATISNLFTKAGYTLTSWNTKADGSGDSKNLDYWGGNDVFYVPESITLYAIYTPIIKEDISLSNDYKILTDSDNVSYQWQKGIMSEVEATLNVSDATLADGVYTSSGGTMYIRFADNSEDITYFRFKCNKTLDLSISNNENIELKEDGYYYTTFRFAPKAGIFASVSYTGEYGIYDCSFTNLEFSDIEGETNFKLNNSISDCDCYYQCKLISNAYNTCVESKMIKTKKISFDKGNVLTATIPNTVYQLEGRKITLGNATTSAYKLKNWVLNQVEYNKDNQYSVGDTDVEFTANWISKDGVNLVLNIQTYTIDDSNHSYIINDSTFNYFKTFYKVNDEWTETVPVEAGSYDVKITRVEDDNYLAFEKIVENGFVINEVEDNSIPTWIWFVLIILAVLFLIPVGLALLRI